MALFDRLLGRKPEETNLRPLWHRVVEIAREPQWYATGGIADSVPGRFDAISTVLSLVLLRMEASEAVRGETARLTELFVADMDGQLRESGVGDVIVGKYMGKMMSALGGRLVAFRAGLAQPEALDQAIMRNIYRSETAEPAGLANVRHGLLELERSLAATSPETIVAGSATW